MSSDFRVIIGLGNPGPSYASHRHNVGFRVLDELAHRAHATWHYQSTMATADVMIGNVPLILMKPLTGMNVSGQVVPLLRKKGIVPAQAIVVHDELELPFGKIVVKQGGSARGHNGLRSLIHAWGDDFYRVRCGIGRPDHKEDVPHYVLSPFSESPSLVSGLIHDAVLHLERLVARPQ